MTARLRRLKEGGRIDRGKQLTVEFDGKRLAGYHGDTIASMLLANDVGIVGRSFKLHRPRGVMTAGVEEPNALVTVGIGARRDPNVSAPTAELMQSQRIESQNRWPSARFDLMAVNRLAGPTLAAGFYYKTFMGPAKKSWMAFEPWIRRAAGLGKPSREADPDRYETRNEFCDVLVVGAGPAGLAAAIAAGRTGARVIIVEQDFLLGGSLLAEPYGSDAADWLALRTLEIDGMANVRLLRRTTAFGLYDHMTVGLFERRDHEQPDPSSGRARQVTVTVRAKAIVIAAGAIERPLVFNNNDKPGVMLASAARVYLNRFAVAPQSNVVISTNNSSVYRTAFDLAAEGISVTVADVRRSIDDDLKARARSLGIDLLAGMAVVDVPGVGVARQALIAEYRGDGGRPDFTLEARPADLVLMSGGWSPTVHLTSHLGVRPRWQNDIAGFVPGELPAGQFVAGAVCGTFATGEAIAEGFAAGAAAAAAAGAGGLAGGPPPPPQLGEEPPLDIEPVNHVRGHRKGKAFIDFQNDVTVADIELAHREGYQSVEHLKRYTTLGMATDQGKTSNINALRLMAELRGRSENEAGTTTFRPPYTGVTIGALAGRAVGEHFRPIRRSPLHDWHAANGAAFIEAGAWKRAWWYRWAGETVETAYVAEMQQVRRAAGIADVSTLGKIDIQGPDALEFINRLYVNGFKSLQPGRARYGVMLADDGIVFDDGTTSRITDTHYFMTTTTAMAGEVMTWLEFLLETAWTDLKVHVSSLTDEWGAMSVAGPKSRAVLEAAFPGVDLANDAVPFMAVKDFSFDGTPIRLVRLSFSGELAFEVFTPAGFATALWEHLLKSGAAHELKPYGLEALASLRIEKGHVAGIELDHRNTLQDLGLGRMAAKEKPFVGRPLMNRPSHLAEDRWSLVGFESLEPEKPLRGGSILFHDGAERVGHGEGYLTSITKSPELGKTIALGLFKGGLAHAGKTVVAAYPLKGEEVRLKIVSPHFIDQQGERLNA